VNLSTVYGATQDRHTKQLGGFTLGETVVRMSDKEVFPFLLNLGNRFFRILYTCLDGTVRDIIGRQGVYKSAQDGEVQGNGHAMRNYERENISFWTCAPGNKVNMGTGKGYRTIRAAGILAIRCEGTDILTDEGIRALADAEVISQ